MTEFTFITASDIHISDTAPRSRTDDFRVTILGKIAQVRSVCSVLNADAMLLAGDLFNVKYPNKNSHRLNQDLIKEFRQFPCPVYMIEGNHDLYGNNLDSLTEQPLGVLFADGTVTQLREQVINKNGVKVSLVGIPYTDNLELKDLKIPSRDGCVSQICLMHLYAGIKGGMLFKERLYGYDELGALSPDIFVIGHYHLDQGACEIGGKWFVNLGSITRGTLAEEDLAHKPQMGLIKISMEDDGTVTKKVTPIRLKIRPAADVFDLTKKEEEQKESKEIEAFVDKLSSEAVRGPDNAVKSVDDLIDKMDMAKVVKDRVLRFIHEATLAK